MYNPWSFQALEELIQASILSIKEPDQRKKYLTNILLIGGGAHLPKFTEEIIMRLNKRYGYVSEEGIPDKIDIATDLSLR